MATITKFAPFEVGRKDDTEKPMWNLLPIKQLEDVVKVLTFGAKKYKENNWKKVKKGYSRYMNAHDRHMAAIKRGEWLDEETGLPHVSHALTSLMFAQWHKERWHGK